MSTLGSTKINGTLVVQNKAYMQSGANLAGNTSVEAGGVLDLGYLKFFSFFEYNKPAIVINKPGDGWFGIGSKTNSKTIYYGACDENGKWIPKNETFQHEFDGTVHADNLIVRNEGMLKFESYNGGLYMKDDIWVRLWNSKQLLVESTSVSAIQSNGGVKATNWFRSTGSSGWYNETHGGGVMMSDSTWVRIHTGSGKSTKKLLVPSTADDAIKTSGGVTAAKVFNAVWNDYAELFERGEDTEPGDIIALDLDSNEEQYIRAKGIDARVVGVHSDSYGHLIGGENVPLDINETFEEYNKEKFIPIGLAGRCRTKISGVIHKGDYVVVDATLPGVGRAYNSTTDLYEHIIGMAVETKLTEKVERVNMKLK